MGCWNGTCMISNLPIFDGDEIKLVILEAPYKYDKFVNVLGVDGYVNVNDLLRPSFYPITGVYNDYGGIEDIQMDWSSEFLQEFLMRKYSNMIVEDKTVSVNIDHFLNGIERGSLKLILKNGDIIDKPPFSSVMIRKDIWDGIVESEQHEKLYRNDQKPQDSDEYYIDAITFVERKLEKLRSLDNDEGNVMTLIKNYAVRDIFYRHETHMNVDCNYATFMFEYILLKENVKKDYFELIVIGSFLDRVRKGWMIQPGKGSQDSDIKPYLLLNKLIEISCQIIENRFNEDYEE